MTPHIKWCLETFEKVPHLAEDQEVVRLALEWHDCASGDGRKICESEIERAEHFALKVDLIEGMIHFRLRHMKNSWSVFVDKTMDLGVTTDLIQKAGRIILVHDMDKVYPNWKAFSHDEQLVREIDRLWMFCEQGIQCDIDRDIKNGFEPKTPDEQYLWNLKVWSRDQFEILTREDIHEVLNGR